MLPAGPYEHKQFEKEILDFWLAGGYYRPEYSPIADSVISTEEMKKDSRLPWCLICPPPNAYGRPHIGNISGYAYMDSMARYQRMNGKKVLVLPGKDHAGLEGEGVFVREVLEKQGRNKFDMKREEFYQEMMEFNFQNMEKGLQDEKNIGLSADFSRNTFTLDPDIVDTVLETFVQMYKKDMIYKGVRIVNWDPKARSVVADNQCVREERDGSLYYIKYPIVSSDESLTVATTRPETMFGDTAVAVNPKDKRFASFIGKTVRIPLTDIEIPVISSFRVLEDFGTGALKITPAHSQDDYQIMMEWNKENTDKTIGYQNVIDKRLTLVGKTPEKYKGRKYKEAKEEILKDLTEQGFLVKEEKVKQNVLIAERTKALIEPLMSSQWYLKYDSIKEESKKMVNDGRINLFPESMVDKFNFWMDNLRDWAISRSLWWGYRLPVWYAGEVKEEIDDNGEVRELIRTSNLTRKLNSEVTVEHARVEDAEAIHRINVDGWHDNFVDEAAGVTLERIQNEFGKRYDNSEAIEKHKADIVSPNYKYLVAKSNGEVIGWAITENLNIDDTKWFDVYVDRNWRSKGIGSTLLDAMISELPETTFHLAVPEKSPAVKFYENYGFVEYDRNSENEYGLPIIQMKKLPEWEEVEYGNENHIKVQQDSPGEGWIQDEDVLDTWFSSGQWVYATLKKYDLMDTFFPSDVMVSGFDILENWISRMIMFTYFHEGKEPFKNVYLTGLVQGTDGQKMSKSKGNMIDMDKIVAEYGTDAVRLAYFYQNSAGASYSITPEKLKNFRGFLNKIWNASKFVLNNEQYIDQSVILSLSKYDIDSLKLDLSKKVLTHINEVNIHITENIEKYQLGLATFNLYQEFWHTYCDILIEESKEYLWDKKDKETGAIISSPKAEDRAEVSTVMIFALKSYLKLLHPFIPFITQTIWNEVPKDETDHKVLMYSQWNVK